MAVRAELAAVPEAGEKYITSADLFDLVDRMRAESDPGDSQFRAVTGRGRLVKRIDVVPLDSENTQPGRHAAGPGFTDLHDDHPSAPLGRYPGLDEVPEMPRRYNGPDL